MSNLTEQDNAKLLTQEECLISDINERLKRLEDLYFSKGQENKQPIDTTEGEFNYCVDLDNGRDKCQEQCDYCVQRQVVLSQKQAPIETEQRWEVTVQSFKYNINDNRITIYLNDGVLSTTEAQKAAEAIKQYLSTNKF